MSTGGRDHPQEMVGFLSRKPRGDQQLRALSDGSSPAERFGEGASRS